MDLIDRYLKAVAAQLPAEERDDIVAELRDLILSRFEAREEELGRPLTEAEQLEILREVGHPLQRGQTPWWGRRSIRGGCSP